MNVLVLMGSPRLHGNTAELCKPFVQELRDCGAEVRYVTLADKDIQPCMGCYACQDVSGEYGCAIKDDMEKICMDSPGEYSLSNSSRIESLHTAIGTLICLQSEIEKKGLSKLRDE